MIELVDTHCHIPLGDEGIGAIERARAAGVTKMICVGTDVQTSRDALALAATAPGEIYATVGLHPHDAKLGPAGLTDLVDDALRNNPATLVAIGECGLDYFYEYSPKELQQSIFVNQIDIAKKNNLALVIHTRDAWDDTFSILRNETAPERTVVHCFTGSIVEARIALEQGFYLSFSGIVTFKKSEELREAAKFCPMDRLLIETDSPYLAPMPFRGKPNEPAYVSTIAKFISDLKNVPVDEFASAIQTNAQMVFRFS